MTRNHRAVLILSAILAPFATGANGSGCGDIVIGGDNPVENPPVENPPVEPPPVDGPAPCGPELHIIGVYETHSDHSYMNHPTGAGAVHVDRKGSMVLALSSYEPVDWTVTVGPDTVLEKVILNGYHAQTAVVPPGVPVETHDGDSWLGSCAYAWPSDDQGCETSVVVAAVESAAGRPMNSFHGCYHASSFVLHDNLSVSSDCAVNQGYEATGYVDPATVSGQCDVDPSDPCADADGLGTYVGHYCDLGYPFIVTHDISCEDALANCELNISFNPSLNLYCEWNGQFIAQGGPDTSACVSPDDPS